MTLTQCSAVQCCALDYWLASQETRDARGAHFEGCRFATPTPLARPFSQLRPINLRLRRFVLLQDFAKRNCVCRGPQTLSNESQMLPFSKIIEVEGIAMKLHFFFWHKVTVGCTNEHLSDLEKTLFFISSKKKKNVRLRKTFVQYEARLDSRHSEIARATRAATSPRCAVRRDLKLATMPPEWVAARCGAAAVSLAWRSTIRLGSGPTLMGSTRLDSANATGPLPTTPTLHESAHFGTLGAQNRSRESIKHVSTDVWLPFRVDSRAASFLFFIFSSRDKSAASPSWLSTRTPDAWIFTFSSKFTT